MNLENYQILLFWKEISSVCNFKYEGCGFGLDEKQKSLFNHVAEELTGRKTADVIGSPQIQF